MNFKFFISFLLISLRLNSSAAESLTPVVLFLGDSLTAGYGVQLEESFPQRLKSKWKNEGRALELINGAESGSLSSSLKSRLEFYLKQKKPSLVVIASGGNDARQLKPVSLIEQNLQSAISLALKQKAKVVLVQMRIFPNLGKEYVESFAAVYPRLAKKNKITLVPFFLEGVAGVPELNQSDGFHPNAKGHEKIAEFLKPYLEKLL